MNEAGSDPVNDVLAVLEGGKVGRAAAARLGVDPREAKRLRAAYRAGKRSASHSWVKTAAVSVVVAVLASVTTTVAQPGVTDLISFSANTPARASDMNFNFGLMKTWIERKVGDVDAGCSDSSCDVDVTGALSSASVSTGGLSAADGNFNGSGTFTGDVSAANVTATDTVLGTTVSSSANVNVGNDLVATNDLLGSRIRLRDGVIQRGGAEITSTGDLGFYSQIAANWIRMVTNDAPIRFFTDAGIGTNPDFSIEANGNLSWSYNEDGHHVLLPESFCTVVPRGRACPGGWDTREVKWDTEDDSNADAGKDNVVAWDDGNSASIRMRFCCRGGGW